MNIEIKKSTKAVKYVDAITQLEARSKLVSKNEDKELIWILAVSYTHLTLPTKRIV